MGLKVAAVDVADEKLTLARELGAELTVNARTEDPVARIQAATGGAHGVLITAVSPIAFQQGVNMLRRGGTCVLNGLPPGDFPVSIFDVVLKRLTIRGSIVGTRKDMQEALQFAADGKVKAIIETQPLEEINSVFDRLRNGTVQGRVVIKMAERGTAKSGS
jgi:propanol-preferring alcohol dehydrogenase